MLNKIKPTKENLPTKVDKWTRSLPLLITSKVNESKYNLLIIFKNINNLFIIDAEINCKDRIAISSPNFNCITQLDVYCE